MKNWKSGILLIAIIFCVAVYIGIFIGRSSSLNTLFVPAVLKSNSITADQASLAVDLNSATVEELLKIGRISEQLAQNIVNYRKENGNFISKLELLRIDGFTYELYEEIKPYVTVGGS